MPEIKIVSTIIAIRFMRVSIRLTVSALRCGEERSYAIRRAQTMSAAI